MNDFKNEWNKIKSLYLDEAHQKEIKESKKILTNAPFVLYGAGVEGIEFANVLIFGKCIPAFFCDKKKSGIEPNTGIQIISPNELLSKYSTYNIIVSSAYYCEEIEGELKNLGIASSRILPRRLLLLLLLNLCSDGTASIGNYLKRSHYLLLFNVLNDMISNEDGLMYKGCNQTYEWLSDEQSKEVFINYLSLCFLAFPVTPSPLYMQYFDPVINLNKNEVYVDCGAYTGDTAQAFMQNVDNKYQHYYAFEPDKENYKKANEFLSGKHDTTLIPLGLWSKNTILNFKEGYTTNSSILDTGDSSVSVISIDSYFSSTDKKPTIIKMDIEGSELEALKGSAQTIRMYKPKLAICIYHKPQDLYEISQFIKSCREDYKFYIRHYTNTFAELVLYAI